MTVSDVRVGGGGKGMIRSTQREAPREQQWYRTSQAFNVLTKNLTTKNSSDVLSQQGGTFI